MEPITLGMLTAVAAAISAFGATTPTEQQAEISKTLNEYKNETDADKKQQILNAQFIKLFNKTIEVKKENDTLKAEKAKLQTEKAKLQTDLTDCQSKLNTFQQKEEKEKEEKELSKDQKITNLTNELNKLRSQQVQQPVISEEDKLFEEIKNQLNEFKPFEFTLYLNSQYNISNETKKKLEDLQKSKMVPNKFGILQPNKVSIEDIKKYLAPPINQEPKIIPSVQQPEVKVFEHPVIEKFKILIGEKKGYSRTGLNVIDKLETELSWINNPKLSTYKTIYQPISTLSYLTSKLSFQEFYNKIQDSLSQDVKSKKITEDQKLKFPDIEEFANLYEQSIDKDIIDKYRRKTYRNELKDKKFKVSNKLGTIRNIPAQKDIYQQTKNLSNEIDTIINQDSILENLIETKGIDITPKDYEDTLKPVIEKALKDKTSESYKYLKENDYITKINEYRKQNNLQIAKKDFINTLPDNMTGLNGLTPDIKQKFKLLIDRKDDGKIDLEKDFIKFKTLGEPNINSIIEPTIAGKTTLTPEEIQQKQQEEETLQVYNKDIPGSLELLDGPTPVTNQQQNTAINTNITATTPTATNTNITATGTNANQQQNTTTNTATNQPTGTNANTNITTTTGTNANTNITTTTATQQQNTAEEEAEAKAKAEAEQAAKTKNLEEGLEIAIKAHTNKIPDITKDQLFEYLKKIFKEANDDQINSAIEKYGIPIIATNTIQQQISTDQAQSPASTFIESPTSTNGSPMPEGPPTNTTTATDPGKIENAVTEVVDEVSKDPKFEQNYNNELTKVSEVQNLVDEVRNKIPELLMIEEQSVENLIKEKLDKKFSIPNEIPETSTAVSPSDITLQQNVVTPVVQLEAPLIPPTQQQKQQMLQIVIDKYTETQGNPPDESVKKVLSDLLDKELDQKYKPTANVPPKISTIPPNRPQAQTSNILIDELNRLRLGLMNSNRNFEDDINNIYNFYRDAKNKNLLNYEDKKLIESKLLKSINVLKDVETNLKDIETQKNYIETQKNDIEIYNIDYKNKLNTIFVDLQNLREKFNKNRKQGNLDELEILNEQTKIYLEEYLPKYLEEIKPPSNPLRDNFVQGLGGGKSRKSTFKARRVNKQNERRRTPRRRKNGSNRSYKNSR